MTAFYNEIDPYAAQWLRNLIAAGHIASGVVDERSIEDIEPAELDGYTQCHFFAGIGVWSLALRKAGWSDDRPVWTGSCPCQPFSSAGKGNGFDDERHLWPAFHHLIRECHPPSVFGEQVASKDADPWIDLVHTDLEALGYAFGAIPFPSAGIGAPHIRDRLYWVGHSNHPRLERYSGHGGSTRGDGEVGSTSQASIPKWMANTNSQRHDRQHTLVQRQDICRGKQDLSEITRYGEISRSASGPTNGYWGSADWLLCRDGKWRPVEPGTFPLAHGITARVGRLRAYGNAINAVQAQIFIDAYLESHSC